MNHIQLHEGFPLLPHPRARAIIDTQALRENYHTLMRPILAVSPNTHAIAVVKADAYGHGIRPVVSALLTAGCRSFAVACLEEAVALRKLLRELLVGTASDDEVDVLVLGYTDPRNVSLLYAYRIATTLLSAEYAARLLAAAREAGVAVKGHVALDTGMNRLGFPAHTEEEITKAISSIRALWENGSPNPDEDEGGIVLDGLYTHFARADEDFNTEIRNTHSLTMTQYARYRRVCDALEAQGIRPRVRHICNSAAAIRFASALPEGCLDAVRLGISLYGYGVDSPIEWNGDLKPVMRLETAVTHIHTLIPGETVGYGGTYRADTPRTLATLPMGYADGWLRSFAGAEVTLHTKDGPVTASIVGRICMDQCMVDITGLPVEVGTPVTLFGLTPSQLTALSRRASTIPYELLCLVTARIPRVYEEI